MEQAQADPAPALTRGLTLLQILEREGASSLDQLTRHCGWPKSSVFRLLASLEAYGAIERDPTTRRFEASLRLVPVDGAAPSLRRAARGELVPLAELCASSAELWAWDGRQLTMLDRADPEDAEVIVRNRIGTSRGLQELEALSQVVHARTGRAVPRRAWAWGSEGRRDLTRDEIAQRIAAARAGPGDDLLPNGYGIARLAAPLLGPDGRLLGVLALARVHQDRTAARDAAAAEHLTTTAERVSTRCGATR